MEISAAVERYNIKSITQYKINNSMMGGQRL